MLVLLSLSFRYIDFFNNFFMLVIMAYNCLRTVFKIPIIVFFIQNTVYVGKYVILSLFFFNQEPAIFTGWPIENESRTFLETWYHSLYPQLVIRNFFYKNLIYSFVPKKLLHQGPAFQIKIYFYIFLL